MRLSIKIKRCELSPVRKFYPYEMAAVAKGLKVRELNIGLPDIETQPLAARSAPSPPRRRRATASPAGRKSSP